MTINAAEVMEKFDDLIGSLDYICYKYNRDTFPQYTPKQWERVFRERTSQLEILYLSERRGEDGKVSII